MSSIIYLILSLFIVLNSVQCFGKDIPNNPQKHKKFSDLDLNQLDNNPVNIYLQEDIILDDSLYDKKLYLEQDGLVAIEMESADLNGLWQLDTIHKGFTGEGYYYYKSDKMNVETENTENILFYPFYIYNAGIYKIVLRNFIANEDKTLENDTFLKLDNGIWWKQFSHNNMFWNWESLLDHGEHKFSDCEWYLDPGLHILQICARSQNFHLDRIHIFNTDLHKDFCYDYTITESILSPDVENLIQPDKQFIQLNLKEKAELSINDMAIKIKNVGSGVLEQISVKSNSTWITPKITGSKNKQELLLTFTDDVKNLETGKHSATLSLLCANATTKEVKVLLIIDPVSNNLAKGKKAFASLTDTLGHESHNAVDGNVNTYWFSGRANIASLYVDLEANANVKKVVLNWGPQYGKYYHIQTSLDGINWKTVCTNKHGNGDGNFEEHFFNEPARYIKIKGEFSYEDNGYWLSEMMVFGEMLEK